MRTQAKKTEFTALRTTKTGDVGERIMNNYLLEKGWHPFPHMEDIAAPVDCIAMKARPGHFDIVAFECKTYPRRFSCAQTGIDTKDYWTYKEIIKTIPLTIFFIDAFEQCVYVLPFAQHYDEVKFDGPKAYFDLKYCTPKKDLTRAELGQINWQPTPHYRNVQKYFL